MRKIMFIVFLVFLWMLGIYEGNCDAAAMFSFIPACLLLEIGFAIMKWQIHKRKMVRRCRQ